ncbi:MAG TPA: bleomycin resistance protein [Candidatus Avipropionibacterium avicola]|uniref:Bleomycin resistance protein n=1 Tax=Candidatus Avipropionibacterium avicola TaxID=2840701 RepID=A0A9D1KMX7_9ACTN|nr:bleomycin resistance protein [Candidatus Avipropionibacterium avicola]
MTNPQLFHSLQFTDVDAAIDWLRAVGFTEAACYRDESGAVVHAQYRWRDNGGIMFGSVTRADDDDSTWTRSAGHGQCYCVVETDDEVDRVHDAAVAAGATSIQAPSSPDYGGRSCAVQDREGNQWSFGSYRGE